MIRAGGSGTPCIRVSVRRVPFSPGVRCCILDAARTVMQPAARKQRAGGRSVFARAEIPVGLSPCHPARCRSTPATTAATKTYRPRTVDTSTHVSDAARMRELPSRLATEFRDFARDKTTVLLDGGEKKCLEQRWSFFSLLLSPSLGLSLLNTCENWSFRGLEPSFYFCPVQVHRYI